jgi:prevent-host-death family protein
MGAPSPTSSDASLKESCEMSLGQTSASLNRYSPTSDHNGQMKVSVGEAKNQLPKLIKAVEDGESVTIYRRGTPVVDIVRTSKAHPEKPKFGTLKGRLKVLDPDWWKAMTDDEVDAPRAGR